MTELLFTPKNPAATNLHQFGLALADKYDFQYESYQDLHDFSIQQAEEFWQFLWQKMDIIADDAPLQDSPIINPQGSSAIGKGGNFFQHIRLNFAENLLRHQEILSDQPAIISHTNGASETISWQTLTQRVSILQQYLQAQGFGAGDIAAGFLPNTDFAVVAMLAVTSLGGVWTSCSPDFGKQGVLDRFGQTQPKILFATDGYFYNGKCHDIIAKLQDFIGDLPSVEMIIIERMLAEMAIPTADTGNIDTPIISWADIAAQYAPQKLHYVRTEFNAALFIMYSSGTTGVPKCIMHGVGGTLLNLLKEHRLHCDVNLGDRMFFYTTCGWMMWNWLVGGLASGATLLLYDESPFYPDKNSLFDFIDTYNARFMGVSAKYIDALMKAEMDIKTSHALGNLDYILTTGSVLSPDAFRYIYQHIKQDVYVGSMSGGTDVLGCFIQSVPTKPVYAGQLSGATLGADIEILDDAGKLCAIDTKGELVCANLFPNMPIGFFADNDGQKYQRAYFAKYAGKWHHGDFVTKTPEGGYIIYGRSDSTLNPGGVRIGTAEIYRTVEQLPEITESLCVGQDFADDVRVILFVVLAQNHRLDDALIAKIKAQIKQACTPRHVPQKIIQVSDVPRTRSGKITELAVKDVIHGKQPNNLSALANAEILTEFSEAYQRYLRKC